MVHTRSVVIILTLCITTIISQHDHDESHDEHWEISTTEGHHEDHDEDIWRAIGITTFAGSASFVGAFTLFCIKKEHIGVLPASLAFAAGVTIYLSFIHLIPESVEQFHHSADKASEEMYMSELLTLFCVIIGILITFCMEALFHHLGVDPHDHSDPTHIIASTSTTHTENKSINFFRVATNNVSDSETQLSDSELQDIQIKPSTSTVGVQSSKPSKPANYSHVSYSLAFALILHHFPEGIATFISLYHDLQFGVLVAFALALHDIPSGICISVPIYLSSGSKFTPFLLCFIAAIVYPIGAFIGWIVIETASQEFMDFFIATLFGITGGIMLYISFVELLPNAIIAAHQHSLADENKKPHQNVYTISIVLLFVGFLVMAISNILLDAVSGGHNH